jgi:hypothetical protein
MVDGPPLCATRLQEGGRTEGQPEYRLISPIHFDFGGGDAISKRRAEGWHRNSGCQRQTMKLGLNSGNNAPLATLRNAVERSASVTRSRSLSRRHATISQSSRRFGIQKPNSRRSRKGEGRGGYEQHQQPVA